jgi:hypothetical protein
MVVTIPTLCQRYGKALRWRFLYKLLNLMIQSTGCEGYIPTFTGDGMMALSGAPVSP